jgi:hypothetical protein
MGRDSSVGIATRYGLDGQWIESRWEVRFSANVQTGPGTHQASYTIDSGVFSGVKRPGRGADQPYTSIPPLGLRGLLQVDLYLYLKVKVKQSRCRPGVAHKFSRNLRFPDFMTTAQDGGKVVSLTHRPPLPIYTIYTKYIFHHCGA